MQRGSTVIYVLILSVVLSATLSVIWTLWEIQRKFLLKKEFFLRAKFGSESAIFKFLDELSNTTVEEFPTFSAKSIVHISATDSAEIYARNWGAYLWVHAKAGVRSQLYSLQTLVGVKPGHEFSPAVILSPHSPALVVSGKSQIDGDVRCGMKGVKQGSLNHNYYPDHESIFGQVYPSHRDFRPALNRRRIEKLFANFHHHLQLGFDSLFTDIIPDSSAVIKRSFKENNPGNTHLISNAMMNMRPWQISGPLTLIASEPLIIEEKVNLKNLVQILSVFPIIISGKGNFEDVIIYSSDYVQIQQVGQFRGQIFSGSSIEINRGIRLDYPSLLLVYNPMPQGSIQLHPESRVSGCLVYLSHADSLKGPPGRGSVVIDSSAILNGLIYSDYSTRLTGNVNGCVITERFHLIHSSTAYINWINNGVVQRNRLSQNFKLPLIFDTKNRLLSPVQLK